MKSSFPQIPRRRCEILCAVTSREPRTRRRPAPSVSYAAVTALLAGALAVAFSISGAPAGAASNAPLATARIPVIIDTDNFSNTDDAGALASAFALDLQGVVNVVAIGVDTRISRPAVATNSWKCAAAIAQFYGFSNVPIGSDMPDNGTSVNSPDIVGPCASFASPTTPAPQSAVSVYRRALASQPNGSVVMVGIGYEENLVALLDSPPDSISPLDGHDLIAEKVKTLTITGGGYPSKSSPGENNFAGNPAAAAVVASSWPTKVVYSGFEVGNGVFTGHTLTSVHPADSPVRADYEALVGPNKNNRSYDLTTLYHAIYPNDPLLTEVGPGTNAIDSVGGNVFTAGAGDEYYLSLSSATALAAVLEALLDVLPGTSPQKITFTSTPPASPKVGDTYSASATGGGSSNPVTFSIDAASTSGCAVNPTTGLVTFSGPAGTCLIDSRPQHRRCNRRSRSARHPRRSRSRRHRRPRRRSARPTPRRRPAGPHRTPSRSRSTWPARRAAPSSAPRASSRSAAPPGPAWSTPTTRATRATSRPRRCSRRSRSPRLPRRSRSPRRLRPRRRSARPTR